MTPGRAALVGLMDRYFSSLLDPFLTLLEVHKLMYFMQAAGEPLKLRFSEAPQGPYAEQPAARASRHRRALRDRLRRWRRRARQAVGAGAAVDDTRRFLGRPATRFSERQLRLAIDVLTRKGWMANLPVSDSGDSAR